MKKIIALLLALVMALTLVACATTKPNTTTAPNSGNDNTKPNDTTEGTDPVENPLAGTYDITMWVSEKDGVAALTQQQIDAFEVAYPGIVINAQIEGVSEADAGSKVVNDVATAPDIFCFAQDQVARLVQAAALAAPSGDIAKMLTEQNDAGSVAAASVAGTLYAYPMTSDNGIYMYYNTSLFTEEDVESLEKIIEICEANNVKFRYALEDAWVNASFFFGAGCHSQWTMNENGEFTNIDDNYNSELGLIAMKGMQKLAQSPMYDSDANIFTDAGVIVTGTWNADAAVAHFGENLGATDLPSFEVDGQSYHLGSFTGNKLMGVKPQADSKKAAVLSLLAQYLTGEVCQQQRFDSFQWGPSNLTVQASDAVQSNVALAAFAKQGAYGVPQGQIHGSWWDLAKALGASAKAATSEEDLKTALSDYENAVQALFSMSDEQKNAWSLIGSICGTMWDTDISMTKIDDTTWESDAIELNAGEEFKIRKGAAWDVQVGADGVMKTPEVEPANIVVETSGKFVVQMIWDGTSTTATVNFIPAE